MFNWLSRFIGRLDSDIVTDAYMALFILDLSGRTKYESMVDTFKPTDSVIRSARIKELLDSDKIVKRYGHMKHARVASRHTDYQMDYLVQISMRCYSERQLQLRYIAYE